MGFRAATRREAQPLGITGYAKNLLDGSVEVLACGEGEHVDALCAWLQHGPRMARVSGVQCVQEEFRELQLFEVG